MPTIIDLGKQVKAKYPQYADMSDEDVGKKVKEKYPTQYADFTDVTTAPTPTPQPKSVGGFLGNIVKSGVGLVGGLASAIIHPIKTVENLAGTALGGIEKLIPGKQAAEPKFDALVNYFKDRYGGLDKIKETAYNDPVGFALDASIALGGVGGAIGKVGELAEIPGAVTAGETIAKAGQIADPLRAMGKAAAAVAAPIGKGAQYLGGLTTRAGAGPIGEVYQAAKEGGTVQEAALSGLRGQATEAGIVGTAKEALSNIQTSRATEYTNAMSELKKANPQSLDITPILDKQQELFDKFNVKVAEDGSLDLSRSPLIGEKTKINAVYNLVNDYGTQTGDRTVTGLDILKRNIRDFRGADSTLNAYLTQLGNSVKGVLTDVNGYEEVMSKYGEKSDLIESIQKDLNLGDKASIDRGFKSLTQAVKTDNELKTALIKSLEQSGAPNLMKQLAGANLADWLPNDIFRVAIDISTIFSAFTGALNPLFALDVFTTSPRIVGELANALGVGARESATMIEVLKRAKALGIAKASYYANLPGTQTQSSNTVTTPPLTTTP